MSDRKSLENSLECPFCQGIADPDVTIKSGELFDKHFDKKLDQTLKCSKCGASAQKVVGCCRLRYVWSTKKEQKDFENVRFFECSDCLDGYYAKVRQRGDRFEIGERLDEDPPDGIKILKQRMLCGDCQGKGGKGDQLNNILKSQRKVMDDLMGS